MSFQKLMAVTILAVGQVALAQQQVSQSPLEFSSSIPWLNQSFHWAKEQALQYGRPGSGYMEPWYEAALPGRNAFCMRDVSHQTEGAAALGLYAANKNMLRLFAQSMAKSRDWAAYWEIDSEGKPSSADYRSDDDFWFNLPANFDVLDAAVRMGRWTGDETYRTDPALQHFAQITMTAYLSTWQLEPGNILARPRIANRRQPNGEFVDSRGIPSYSEGTKDFILGTDLLAAEYRAMISYSQVTGDAKVAQSSKQKAAEIQAILERVGWSDKDRHYLSAIHGDLSGYGSGDNMILYFHAASNPKHIQGALDYVSSPSYWKETNIEDESYIPLTLFRYGRNQVAYQVLANISDPQKQRREYPEVSYSVIAAITGGVMGIAPGGRSDGYDVSTLSGLLQKGDSATMTALAIRRNQIEVRHTGTLVTSLSNLSGPSLRWRAEFRGSLSQVVIANKVKPTQHSTTPEGVAVSWIDVQVNSGSKVTVSALPAGSATQ